MADPIIYDMPEMDARTGTCGVRGPGYDPCRKQAVIRVEIETREYELHEETHEFHPYAGELVMVDVCADHKDKMSADYLKGKQFYQDRADQRAEKAATVERLRAELEAAEAELSHL